MTETLEIRFIGEGISPENVRIGEIADILNALENVLLDVVSADHPGLSKDALTVGLQSISAGSLDLRFSSKMPEVVTPAFHKVAATIQTGTAEAFSEEALGHFEKIMAFVRKRQAQADFVVRDGGAETLATLTPDFAMPSLPMLSGQTTLFGEIVRVGGVEPKVEVKTVSGKTLYCPFEYSLASELGALLYQTVGLRGKATWNGRTLEIDDFTVTGVSEYRRTPLPEAFDSLGGKVGRFYEHIQDVREHVGQLRRGV